MTTAWAVVYNPRDGRQILSTDTIRRTRQESIAAAIDWLRPHDPAEVRRRWRRLRRADRVACVRVEVREVGE
jgi:hypothetical protein